MTRHARSSRVERGFTLVELMVVVAIVALLAASALPIYQRGVVKAHKTALVADMNTLYKGFMSYQFDNNRFPPDTGAGALDRRTLDPLASAGYFPNPAALNRKLAGQQIRIYFAPDWNGPNADFIALAQSAIDPSMIFYVMHYSFMGAFGYDGVYVLQNGLFVRPDEAI